MRCPDVGGGIVGGVIAAPDETPIEHTPDWEPGDGQPGDVVVRGGAIALDRLLANGVTYKNPQAGPGNKKVSATLIETGQAQGHVAPLVVDGDNFAGVTFDPGTGHVKAEKTVAGSKTTLGQTSLTPVSGVTQIGAVAKDNQMWMTVAGQIAGGPYNVSEISSALQSGIVAKGPASATAWISNFASKPLYRGYGRGYGLSHGG